MGEFDTNSDGSPREAQVIGDLAPISMISVVRWPLSKKGHHFGLVRVKEGRDMKRGALPLPASVACDDRAGAVTS